jgi:hypothetical protein
VQFGSIHFSSHGDSMHKHRAVTVFILAIRLLAILAVMSAVIMLAVDSPLLGWLRELSQASLSFFSSLWPPRPALFEAAPLMLVGLAFLASLFVSRPSGIELTKQILLGSAFVLWAIDLLLPQGLWATLIGAVVIALYVFDLAWMIEGNLRKHQPHRMAQSPAVLVSDDPTQRIRRNGSCHDESLRHAPISELQGKRN